jgi:hypothetical protein
MKRNGRVVLLDCGHHSVINTTTADCPACEGLTDENLSGFARGYRAGLSAKHNVCVEDMRRLGGTWLEIAGTKLQHTGSCLCRCCIVARRMLLLSKMDRFESSNKYADFFSKIDRLLMAINNIAAVDAVAVESYCDELDSVVKKLRSLLC